MAAYVNLMSRLWDPSTY